MKYDRLEDKRVCLHNPKISDMDYDNVYLDIDLNIEKKKSITSHTMKFIYNQKNTGKCIHVISSKNGDLIGYLDNMDIPHGIFTSVSSIPVNCTIFRYIADNSIIINDFL